MKEIGEQFKDKRLEISISIEEVADDLDVDKVLIENLEEGNSKAFKDILELKDVITAYAKYLGLNGDEILEALNDFLFEKTSKISVDDIKEELNKTKPEEKKIKSPYTLFKSKEPKPISLVIVSIIIIVLVLLLFYIILRKVLVG